LGVRNNERLSFWGLLRLSYGMGLKSALADLWSDGGKGVIASPGKDKIDNSEFRRNMFLDYGDFLTSLNGKGEWGIKFISIYYVHDCICIQTIATCTYGELKSGFRNTRTLKSYLRGNPPRHIKKGKFQSCYKNSIELFVHTK